MPDYGTHLPTITLSMQCLNKFIDPSYLRVHVLSLLNY